MLANVSCRVLTNSSEKEYAAGIVYKKYSEEGYIHDGEKKSSGIASYIKEGTANTFGVFAGGEMYGTLSLVFDGERGLPMDLIYKHEVDILRDAHYKIAEVVQFALDKDIAEKHLLPPEVPMASIPLFGYLLSHAEKHKIDHLCISVNPKHATFYTLIGFKKFGEEKHYESVDAPAVAMSFLMKDLHGNSFGKNAITKMIATFFNTDDRMV